MCSKFSQFWWNKANGGDGIPAELFQILKDDAVKMLHSICQQIWKTQQWPQDWKRSIFIPIPKKGNLNSEQCFLIFQFSFLHLFSKIYVTFPGTLALTACHFFFSIPFICLFSSTALVTNSILYDTSVCLLSASSTRMWKRFSLWPPVRLL